MALKREITLSRLMRESLGERLDLVRVLDWNLEQAPFFIALEHCNEGSLVEWADRQGGIRQVPMVQRLELLAKAADALAGPHRLGVLHKDLKPSNLLLHKDREGTLSLKLADFGSARLVDRRSLVALGITQLGFTQTLAEPSSGTPLYLAPELLSGRPPTTRSDVYALGVMLYQLVVGELRRPLAPGWERGVEDPLLVEDIDAAAGDPERRLADPAQLAERLRTLPARREVRERQLDQARAAEDVRLALERSRARRGLRIGLAITLVAGLIVSAVLFVRAQRASVEAQASAQRASMEAARANAVAAFLTDDVLSAANPMLAGRRDVAMREVLDAAQPRSRARNGRFGEALPLLQASHEGMRKHFPEERTRIRVTAHWLSISRLFAGDVQQAKEEMAKALEQNARIFGAGSRQYRVARMWYARALLETGQTSEAQAELEAVRALWLADPAGAVLDYARHLHHLAIALQRAQQPRAALEVLEDGLARVSKVERPSGYWTLILREQMADVRLDQKDRPGAEQLLRQNLDEARELFKQGEWLLGWCAYRLGAHLADDRRTSEALPLLKEAVPILEASLGADEQRSREARERMLVVARRVDQCIASVRKKRGRHRAAPFHSSIALLE